MEWLTLLTGFFGALLGAASAIGVQYLQNQSSNKHELAKRATDCALEELKWQKAFAQELANHLRLYANVPAFDEYVIYHTKLQRLLIEGEISDEAYQKILKGRPQVTINDELTRAANFSRRQQEHKHEGGC